MNDIASLIQRWNKVKQYVNKILWKLKYIARKLQKNALYPGNYSEGTYKNVCSLTKLALILLKYL